MRVVSSASASNYPFGKAVTNSLGVTPHYIKISREINRPMERLCRRPRWIWTPAGFQASWGYQSATMDLTCKKNINDIPGSAVIKRVERNPKFVTELRMYVPLVPSFAMKAMALGGGGVFSFLSVSVACSKDLHEESKENQIHAKDRGRKNLFCVNGEPRAWKSGGRYVPQRTLYLGA